MIFQFDKTNGFNIDQWNKIVDYARELPDQKFEVEFIKPKRTKRQNNALYKWFEMISDEMKEKGISLKVGWGDRSAVEYKPEPDDIKYKMFYPVMEAKTGKDSTAKLTTKEVDEVAEPIKNFLSEEWELLIPFPSHYNKLLENDKL